MNGVYGTFSDSGGYYVVANLNLNAGEDVTVYANKSSQYGSNTGTADSWQAAFVNVTMCSAPNPPTLTSQPDIHTTSANLSWTSGTDPNNLSTYDRYQLDTNPIISNATSPQYESGLSYSSHTWKVQTCNPGCCSAWESDTFQVYNNQPTSPTLTDQQDTLNSSVTLYWTSGSDPDGDSTYDEYQFHSNPIISNATSPQNETGLSYQTYTWKVRTCDVLGACSDWAIDTFSVINNPCPPPVLVPVSDGFFTNVTLNWTSNSTDTDGDPCHDRFQFDSDPIIDPATPPQTKTGLSLGVTYTWRVQSCDNKGACSVWVSDTFSTQNNAPSKPNLTDQPHTDASSVALEWISGVDPDGNPTYDEYRFNYSSIVTNATSPQIETITGIQFLTWQVRTCDIYGACSGWATDTFIRYECPECVCEEGGGGGGGYGGGIGVIYRNVTPEFCKEEWVCEDWSPCIRVLGKYKKLWGFKKLGIQVRDCIDKTNCGTTCSKPDTWQYCKPPKPPEIDLPILFTIPKWTSAVIFSLIAGLAISLLYLRKLKKVQNAYKKTAYYKKWLKSLYKKPK